MSTRTLHLFLWVLSWRSSLWILGSSSSSNVICRSSFWLTPMSSYASSSLLENFFFFFLTLLCKEFLLYFPCSGSGVRHFSQDQSASVLQASLLLLTTSPSPVSSSPRRQLSPTNCGRESCSLIRIRPPVSCSTLGKSLTYPEFNVLIQEMGVGVTPCCC